MSRIPPAPHQVARAERLRRKPALLTTSDARIAGHVAAIAVHMAGGGFFQSIVAGFGVPMVAKVTGLAR